MYIYIYVFVVFPQLEWRGFCPQRSLTRPLGLQPTWSPDPWCGSTCSSLGWFSHFWWSVHDSVHPQTPPNNSRPPTLTVDLSVFFRVDWRSTVSYLLRWSAYCRRCTWACFCPRPRERLCRSSPVNSTGSTSKARIKSTQCHRRRLSISWVKSFIPHPCREAAAAVTSVHSTEEQTWSLTVWQVVPSEAVQTLATGPSLRSGLLLQTYKHHKTEDVQCSDDQTTLLYKDQDSASLSLQCLGLYSCHRRVEREVKEIITHLTPTLLPRVLFSLNSWVCFTENH